MNNYLLKPVHDETFSSWAIRCSLSPQSLLISDVDIFAWEKSLAYQFLSQAELPGMEFDFEALHAKSFLLKTGFSEEHVQQLFAPSDDLVLSPVYRAAFCHECVLADATARRFPSWRKSWCYVARPYCEKHGCLLRFMNGHRGYDKQWSAFALLDLGEFMPGRMAGRGRAEHGVPHSAARAFLTLRIQRWVQSIYNSYTGVVGPMGQQVENRLMRDLIDLMLRVLLVHRTRRAQSGIAKSAFSSFWPPVFHGAVGLGSRLAHGAPNSVPYERMCALWLVGVIFRLFTPSELSSFERMIRDAEFAMPVGWGDLGQWCGAFLLEGEGAELADLIFGLNVNDVLDGEFVEGLTGRAS